MTTPPQAPTRPRRAEVRQAVLAAAAASFLERGYAGSSVADVASRAGFTKGAVYSNFGSKPALFAAVWAEVFDDRARRTQAAAAQALGPQDKDPRRVAQALAGVVADTVRWQVVLSEFRALALGDLSGEPGAVHRELRLAARRRVGELVGELELFDPHGPDPELVAIVLGNQVNSLALDLASGTVEPHQVTDVFELLVRSLLP